MIDLIILPRNPVNKGGSPKETENWERAWRIDDDFEGRTVLVFATSYPAARRQGAEMLEIDYATAECRRAPEFDSGIPDMETLVKEHGWHWGCHGCEHSIDSEGCSRCHSRLAIFSDGLVYCSARCQHRHRSQWHPGVLSLPQGATYAHQISEYDRSMGRR